MLFFRAGPEWNVGVVPFRSSEKHQLMFEAVRGSDIQSDIVSVNHKKKKQINQLKCAIRIVMLIDIRVGFR